MKSDVEYSMHVIMLAFKKFHILGQFGFQIFRLGMFACAVCVCVPTLSIFFLFTFVTCQLHFNLTGEVHGLEIQSTLQWNWEVIRSKTLPSAREGLRPLSVMCIINSLPVLLTPLAYIPGLWIGCLLFIIAHQFSAQPLPSLLVSGCFCHPLSCSFSLVQVTLLSFLFSSLPVWASGVASVSFTVFPGAKKVDSAFAAASLR